MMMFGPTTTSALLLGLLVVGPLGALSRDEDGAIVVDLPSLGRLRGTLTSQGADYILRAFKGVPFAEPPVGPLRFQPPVPVQPWKGTKAAVQFKPMCTQRWPRLHYPTGAWDDVEDCL